MSEKLNKDIKQSNKRRPMIISVDENTNINGLNDNYKPLAIVLSKRIYRVSAWKEVLKIILFHNFNKLKRFNKDALIADVNVPITKSGSIYIASDVDDSNLYAKFADNLYVHVYFSAKDNLKELKYFKNNYNCKFELYIVSYVNDIDESLHKEYQDKCIEEVIEKEQVKEKRSRNYISYINNKVLSKEEKFYKRIEKEFDSKILIGDIPLYESEFSILNSFMKKTLKGILVNYSLETTHDKVFAYGLVKYASKYYSQNRFWPFFKDEYGFDVPVNKQSLINTAFEKIMKKYNKAYIDFETSPRYSQNICMHAFICDNCADQLFDYIFEFWRIDLNRSVENMIDDSGNNIFDILIDEIENDDNMQIQDIMAHTTMAMRVNRRSCRSKFKRILMMVDNSYWNDADYSSSNDRITTLFNEWKRKPSSAFVKEQKKDNKRKITGRGKKMLSTPTIVYDQDIRQFKIVLPKEILRFCDITEHPEWSVVINNRKKTRTPTLLEGKAALYSDECCIPIISEELFSNIEITLSSEKRSYIKKTIQSEDVRFFSDDFKHLHVANDCVSKDLAYAFIKNGKKLEKVGSNGGYVEKYNDNIDLFYLECVEGDLFILPDGKAVSVGSPIKDGLIGANRIKDVSVIYNQNDYEVFKDIDQLFFKTSKEKMRGTSLKISKSGEVIYNGRINVSELKEFKLCEMADDTYGYLIKLSDYIENEGLYSIQLDIPGLDIRKYRICFLNDFNYCFNDAPYIFKESGSISLPLSFNPKNTKDWDKNEHSMCLTFSFKESDDKDKNEYFVNNKLLIKAFVSNEEALFAFDVPVLFWKFKEKDSWSYLHPKTLSVKDLPYKIYVSGNLPLSSSSLFINDEMRYESETMAFKDKESSYCYRTADFVEYLGKDKDYKTIGIQINNISYDFMTIACRSIVKNYSVIGVFEDKKIIGEFDIVGNSEYYVSISEKNTTIEDYVPLINGCFEVECNVHEGMYTVSLFELEEDDTGFDSSSYKLIDIPVAIKDMTNLTDRCLDLVGIEYLDAKFEGFSFKFDYKITSIKKLDYYNDIFDKIDILTWKHDPSNHGEMSQFDYYKGSLVKSVGNNYGTKLFNVLVMLQRNVLSQISLYYLDDDEAREVCFDNYKKQIVCDESSYSRVQKIKYLRVLYDDEYIIKVKANDNHLKINKSLEEIANKSMRRIENISIESVNFTERTYISLKKANINTLSQLAKMTDNEMQNFRNLDKKQIHEIHEVLDKFLTSYKED